MTIEHPARLKDGELGAVLRAANSGVTPERLASNAARIKAKLAAATAFALWKLLVTLGVLALAVAVTVKLATRTGEAPPPAPVAPALEVTTGGEPETHVAATAPVEVPPAPAHVEVQPALPQAIDAGVAAPLADAAPEPSQLPAQIALYESARAAAARGELTHAIELLDQLLRDYPTTQLRADAELTRAELLARGDRADAVAALEAASADPVHAGRRAELLRTLGDLHRRRGECAKAIAAYDRALAAHPGDRDRKDAEAGRDHCMRK